MIERKTGARRGARRSPGHAKAARAATKRKVAGKKQPPPSGYATSPAGVYVPEQRRPARQPVAPAKIRSGLAKARAEIERLLQELGEMTSGYSVSELELAVSFSADGKFLGIGVGGATTIRIRLKPDGGD